MASSGGDRVKELQDNVSILTNIRKHVDTFMLFLESELCPKHEVPIVVGFYCNTNDKFILYNTEQLSRKSCLHILISYAKNPKCIEIWDYSHANVEICKRHNITTRHVPLSMPECALSKFRLLRMGGQPYDFGFAGCDSPRRKKIMDGLENAGYKINYIVEKYGEERDIEMAKCKILLNIHVLDDFLVFESARCEPWLAIGWPIISEHSIDDDPRCINVTYEELVNKSIEMLENIG
jgi:hypothetical protein